MRRQNAPRGLAGFLPTRVPAASKENTGPREPREWPCHPTNGRRVTLPAYPGRNPSRNKKPFAGWHRHSRGFLPNRQCRSVLEALPAAARGIFFNFRIPSGPDLNLTAEMSRTHRKLKSATEKNSSHQPGSATPLGPIYGGGTTGTGAMPRPDGLDPVGVDPKARIPKGCNP